jgi:hypothetical protein
VGNYRRYRQASVQPRRPGGELLTFFEPQFHEASAAHLGILDARCNHFPRFHQQIKSPATQHHVNYNKLVLLFFMTGY